MSFWEELDSGSQNIIKTFAVVVALIICAFCWYKVNQHDKALTEDLIISRSPLREMTLLQAFKKDDGYYVSAVDKLTAKRYENIFITKTCPSFKNPVGTLMNVALIYKVNPQTGEGGFNLARVYDYICTKKNMAQVDKELLDVLKKADDDFAERNPMVIETIQSGVKPNYIGE